MQPSPTSAKSNSPITLLHDYPTQKVFIRINFSPFSLVEVANFKSS